MIHWLHPLYMDRQTEGLEPLIRFQMKYRKYPGDYYFIILPQGQDMPEMMAAAYLKQPYYENQDLTVIGTAAGKAEAFELFRQIAQDAYNQTGDVNIRAFLKL